MIVTRRDAGGVRRVGQPRLVLPATAARARPPQAAHECGVARIVDIDGPRSTRPERAPLSFLTR